MSDRAGLATLGDADGDVLLVDDFPDTLALYDAVLTEDGHRVRTAPNGLEALRKVDEREPELVLLDVSMPGLDGVQGAPQATRASKRRPRGHHADRRAPEPHAIEAGLMEGADAYLTKPIDSRELVARVRAALETYRLKRVLEAQRRDHIAMLVHDLRHPLSSLGLIAELLESEDMPADVRAATVAQIRGMCSEMARLVDGVLVASRLEAGVFSVQPRPVTAAAIIGPMLAVFTPIASRRRIALSFEGSLDLPMRVDSQKLRQAVDNLVANALKFTPRGGRVRVRVWRESEHVTFEIADTGPGIAPAERDSIFDRYKQGSRGRGRRVIGSPPGASPRPMAESISVTYSGDMGGTAFRIELA